MLTLGYDRVNFQCQNIDSSYEDLLSLVHNKLESVQMKELSIQSKQLTLKNAIKEQAFQVNLIISNSVIIL